MSDLELWRTLLLFVWAFGLAGVEVEIEGGYCWAERMPTWYLKRGRLGGPSIILAALAAWSAGTSDILKQHLWMLLALAVLIGLTVLAAPLYHRSYRYMRRAGADDRRITRTYPPPAPEASWAGGDPDLHPLDSQPAEDAGRREP
jgi:hypothetical protein